MKIWLVSICLGAAVLVGCSTTYSGRAAVPVQHTTQIVYRENDFQLRKAHVTGSSECGYVVLFGAIGDPRVQSNALKELYKSIESGNVNRSTQLVNWTQDQVWTSYPFSLLPIYRTHRVVYSADLIEFVK